MAKRGAEKQLTDQNWERDGSDDDGSASSEGAFKAAAPEALAGRRIRGLPQRKGPASAPAAPAPSAAFSAPAFGGFTGFGSAAPASSAPPSNPFASMGSSATSTAASFSDEPARVNPFASTTFSFGATAPKSDASKPAVSTPAFTFGPSSTPPSAPPTFGASSSSTPFTFGSSKPAAATSSASTTAADGPSPALTYYLGLRGLNLSLVDALAKEIEKDPFIDLAGAAFDSMKRRYESHRNKIESDYAKAGGKADKVAGDTAPAAHSNKPSSPTFSMPVATSTPASTTATTTPAPSFPSFAPLAAASKPAEESPKSAPATSAASTSAPAPPAPPATFSWGGNVVKPTTDTSSKPVGGGFVFKPDAPKDPYAEKSGFSFPTGTEPPSAKTSTSASTSAASASASKPTQSTEATKRTATKLSNAPSAPSPLRFGESVSPPPSPSKPLPEDFKSSEEPKKDYSTVPPPAPFSFGGAFGKIAKGADEAVAEKKLNPTAPTFSFGATPGSTSSSLSESTLAPAAASTAAASSGFTFGTPIKFGSSAPPSSKPTASPPLSTSFGSGSPPSFGFGAALGKSPTPTASNASAGFSFGVSPGFSFGSSASASKSTTASAPTAAAPAFSFGSSAPSSAPSFGAAPTFSFGVASSAAPSTAPSSATSTPPALGGTESHADTASSAAEDDLEVKEVGPAEGEEDESSIAEGRGKVYELTKEGENVQLGIVNVWIKEREAEGKKVKRVLARNEVNKSVVLNFRLHSGFTVKIEKMFLTFQGFEGSDPKNYRIRFKSVTDASEFKDKLEEAAQSLA